MARKWKELANDEIYAMWQSYIKTETSSIIDIGYKQTETPTLRLTSSELHALIEELLVRLSAKESIDAAL